MAQLIRADSINFAEYERNTEAEHKVRAAADFFDDVRAKFRANAGRQLDAGSVAALEEAVAHIDATGLDPLAMALARAGHTT
jgi:hypothetical protein